MGYWEDYLKLVRGEGLNPSCRVFVELGVIPLVNYNDIILGAHELYGPERDWWRRLVNHPPFIMENLLCCCRDEGANVYIIRGGGFRDPS